MEEFLVLVVVGWARAVEKNVTALLKNLGEILTPQTLAEVLAQSVILAPFIFASIILNHLTNFFQDLGNDLSRVIPIELIRSYANVLVPKNHGQRVVPVREAELTLVNFIADHGINLIQTQTPRGYVAGRRLQTTLTKILTFPEWIFKLPGLSALIFRLIDVMILLTIGVIRFASSILVVSYLIQAKESIEKDELFGSLSQEKRRQWTRESVFKRIP